MKTIKHLMLYAVGIPFLSLTSCNEGDNIGTDLPSQTQRTQKVRFVINPLQIPQPPNNGDPADIALIPMDNTYAHFEYKYTPPITNDEGATAAEKKVQSASIQYGVGVYESEMKCGHYQLLGFEVFNMGADHKPQTDDDYIAFLAPKREDLTMSLPPQITDHALPINFTVNPNIDAKIVVPVIPHHEPDRSSEMGNTTILGVSIYGSNLKWLDFRLRVEMGFTGKYIGNYKLIIQRGSDTIAEHTFGRFTADQTTARWIDILYDPAKTDDIDLSVIYKKDEHNTFKGVKTIAYKDWLEKVDPHGVPYSIMRSVVLVHLSKI